MKELLIDPAKGYPAADNINYKCGKCGDLISSKPNDNISCSCSNIVIDVDAGRISVKDHSQFKAYMS